MSQTGQMKTKLMDVVDSLDALERTPTAFNWTPEMRALWPDHMRPTMTGLLAIWEAMHEAAEYSETADPLFGYPGKDEDYYTSVPKPLADVYADSAEGVKQENPDNGWIRHSGGGCPVGREINVDVITEDGYEATDFARNFQKPNNGSDWWTGETDYGNAIKFWRPAK